ncbi:hypothetical protein CEXT_187051 [Caerostris extrusa]|uniref:Uncharacterized protein n=1 Tax=Caerostris extrusa TaxID=172846 RepID=A0AAV4XCT9_CAEEX|nr:hypothetical protein CEXT_187051 [Caerostris extrusa]
MFMINLNFDLFPDYFRRKTYFYGTICVLPTLGLIILALYRYTRATNTNITDNLRPPDGLSFTEDLLSISKEFYSTSGKFVKP